ncbi:hypothetical protein DAI22_03g137450 [Oryza sativa Japonica Group]|nr:hypothetical protein DAI22_03g137450 [Oryza sativa Japonica Group]
MCRTAVHERESCCGQWAHQSAPRQSPCRVYLHVWVDGVGKVSRIGVLDGSVYRSESFSRTALICGLQWTS